MKIWLLVLGMSAVTYLPRLIPLIILKESGLPRFWQRFLSFIPYTALGALIIPGVFDAVPGKPLVALAGIIAAFGLSWFRGGLVISVLGSVAVSYLVLVLMSFAITITSLRF